MSATTIDVSNEQQLNQAIASADAAMSGSFDIVFTTPTITEGTDTGDQIDFVGKTFAAPPDLYAINLQSGVSLAIDGVGGTLDGANTYRGFFVYSGNVAIDDLTITDTTAEGGAGAGGGGGGAGLGGGLFVAGARNVDGYGSILATGGTVALDGVTFSGDAAIGGAGGSGESGFPGGGGGLGGSGGSSTRFVGGGGGIGSTASGSGSTSVPGASGIVLGAAGGGSGVGANGSAGGASGGGGGAGGGPGLTFGGGGGVRGAAGSAPAGGHGGFGGGGGGAELAGGELSRGGTGGFGGGGGVGARSGGAGGFGGGGGFGNVARPFGSPGPAGTGGGAGASRGAGGTGGGGGLGAGGDIFVQQGGVLTVEGGSLSGGSVTGGLGAQGGGNGAAWGSGIFIQGNQVITLGAPSGQVLAIGDAITGRGGTAAGGVAISGSVDLTAFNSGLDVTLDPGAVLQVGNGSTGALDGTVIFPTDPATLVLDGSDAIQSFLTASSLTPGNPIELTGETFTTDNLTYDPTSGELTIAASGGTFTLNFTDLYPGATFEAVSLAGGDAIELVPFAAATADGDWANPAIWSTGTAPDSSTADVLIPGQTTVAIGATESFVAGVLGIGSGGELTASGGLTVMDGLTLAGGTAGNGGYIALAGSIEAGNIEIGAGAPGVQGVGALASSGPLTNDGTIYAVGSAGQTLAVEPASYAGPGVLGAGGGAALVLAPGAGPAGFGNLSNGTLTGGTYIAASGGTLELPGPVTALDSATMVFDNSVAQFGPPRIDAGGTSLQATLGSLGSGAFLILNGYDYTTANALTLNGAVATLENGAVLSAPDIVNGSSSELFGTGTIDGNIENSGFLVAHSTIGGDSILDLSGTLAGGGFVEIESLTTLELGTISTASVTLQDASVLRLDDPIGYSGTLFDFEVVGSNAIDLLGYAPDTLTKSYSGNPENGTLTVRQLGGDLVASLTFAGDYTQAHFVFVSDGSGGTDIEISAVPCFARGTQLATPNGDVAVEDLRVGDCVLTASGDARPIVWIGERRVDCTRHPRTDLVHPVHIRPGAFAEDQPRRDLFLSPDHAVFCDGVLIPAYCLI